MIKQVINGRKRDLGHGMKVWRTLPSRNQSMVGPFIFFDHAGPLEISSEILKKSDIRPHPHIGIVTVSYLFDGAMTHRDSLGSFNIIHPGDVNWMTAGRGVSHSERFDNPGEPPFDRLEYIQTWVALPDDKEDIAPAFEHHPASALPAFESPGISGRVILGRAWDMKSPVKTYSPVFYVHLVLAPEAWVELPNGYSERAAYIVKGSVSVGGTDYESGQMLVFHEGEKARIRAKEETVLMLLGGEPVGERLIWWNFVASRQETIEQAKKDWQEGRIPLPPDDNKEFTPLPGD